MKKLISVFAALALVGSLAAQKGKKPAAKAPAAPVVAAPKAPAMPAAVSAAPAMAGAAKALGLTIGFGVGYETNLLNRTGQAVYAGLAGGGGFTDFVSRAAGNSLCSASTLITGSGATTCSGTGDGKATTTAGIPLNLLVQFEIVGPFFLRSGFGYTIGLKNEYNLTATGTNAAGDTMTRKMQYSSSASMMEIPILIGINVLKTETSRVYVAAGIQYSTGTFTHTLTASDTGTGAFTSKAYESVENKIDGKGIGIHYLVGGKIKVSDSVSVFGEIKWLKQTDSSATITAPTYDPTKTYASDNNMLGLLPASAKTTLDITGSNPQPLRGTTAGTNGTNVLSTNGTVMNLGYDARVVFGVNYEM